MRGGALPGSVIGQVGVVPGRGVIPYLKVERNFTEIDPFWGIFRSCWVPFYAQSY